MTTPIHAGSEMTEENAQTTAQKLAPSEAEMSLRLKRMIHAREEALRLFGYALCCDDNHAAVATALIEISDVLAAFGDVQITVTRLPTT
jgi:hypothetical protein